MANTFIEVKKVARDVLPRLIDNLVMPNLCYTDYSGDYSDLGNVIQVKKPIVFEAQDFTVGSTVNVQDITETSVDVVLDKIATIDLNINALEGALNVSEEKYISIIEAAAVALAEKINKAGVEIAAKEITNILGTSGSTPDGLDDFSAARKFLNKAKAPLTDRVAIWDVEADAQFKELGNLVKVNESGSPRALREGEIGRVFGLDNYMTQAIEQASPSGAGTIAVDGAASRGATELHVDGVTTDLAVGDTFTIADNTGVYTVVAAKANESGDQDITIAPALSANVADNKAITLLSPVNNLVFHKNAIAFVTRPLSAPKGAESYTTSFNGISLRVVRDYDITTKTEKLSVDVLYNYKVVYPEIAARYLG